ncbi:MAG: alpha/beta hydrolase [Cyanobacteriota bacterium]|nr:alpha/beta hydrolase [Cyanobacteriota bacterium]
MGDRAQTPHQHSLKLRDGRLLGYAEYGDPQGQPVFYFHGMPASRLEAKLAENAARTHQVRIVACDRPGMGLSDFQAGRTIADWPRDVVELADALAIERFAVLGVSGGGAYAAVCALKIPQRLTHVGIASGMVPLNTPGATGGMGQTNRISWFLAHRVRWLYRWLLRRTANQARRDPERFWAQMMPLFGDRDRALLERPEVREIAIATFLDAFRNGTRGVAWEMGLQARPWGFRLEEIAKPVFLWHGEQDTTVPPAMGRYQARTIPNCMAKFDPNAGHASLIFNHIEEIIAVLSRY